MKNRRLFFLIAMLLSLQVQAQNQLIGPAKKIGIIRKISPNGRYVVGQESTTGGSGKGYVWDTWNGNEITPLSVPSEAFGVTDNRIIAGNFSDVNCIIEGSAIRTGGYVDSGAVSWTGLGFGLISPPITSLSNGTSARSITADGKTIVGYSRKYEEGNGLYVAYSWTKNEAGEWLGEEWAYPSNAIQSYIIDIASDGKTAVGFIHDGDVRRGILWKSKSEYLLPLGVSPVDGNHYSEYLCVSQNGKYAGFNYSGQAGERSHSGVYNIETGEIMLIPGGILINSVSNDGIAVGIYRPGITNKAFIWHKKMGLMDFGEFLSQYAPDIELSSALQQTFSSTSANGYSVNAVTPDGLNFVIRITNTQEAYVLKLSAPFVMYPYPKNLSATLSVRDRNKVNLAWDAPDLLAGENLTEYAVFRDVNVEPVGRVTAETKTYTDENVPSGYHTYRIKAVFDGKYSSASNPAQATVVNTHELPLIEDFNSLNLTRNFWTIEKEQGTFSSPGWDVDRSIGINGAGAYFYSVDWTGKFASSLVSKYLNGVDAKNIYLSFTAKPDYYYRANVPVKSDTVFVDVCDYESGVWTNTDKSVYNIFEEWRANFIDLTSVAAGKFFKVRLRVTGINDSDDHKFIYFDDVRVSTTPPDGNAPKNIMAKSSNDTLQLAWQHPDMDVYALTYSNSSKRFSIGNAGVPFIAVNRFDTEDLAIYKNKYLTSVTVYINQKVTAPETSTTLRLAVFEDDARTVDQAIDDFIPNGWNTFTLENPVLLTDKNLKFGVEVTAHDAKEEPIGVDGNRNPVIGRSDLFWDAADSKWKTLYSEGVANSWCIIGNVADGANTQARDAKIIGYNVYKDGIRLNKSLIFGQSYKTDDVKGRFSVRAYSIESGLSAEALLDLTKISSAYSPYGSPNVYPNPAKDVINIDSEKNIESVSVFDMTGRLLEQIDSWTGSLSTKNWKQGVYLIKIITPDGEATRKVVKE
ncbi:MAG: T9SS type A sorting domain-containing protein [Dysgonamonadaceae bacterium]|nr:T9SS type A sorting domain-containing protein [Dysgonamonadaceae bacterium]